MLLAPSCGRILKIISLFSILQCIGRGAESLSFAFQMAEAEVKPKFVISP